MSQRIEWARRMYERVAERGEVPGELLAEDVVWHTPPDVPKPMVIEGREEVVRRLGGYARSMDDFAIVAGEITDLGDRVVAAVRFSGRAPGTDDSFEFGGAQVWWFDEDGLATEVREFRSLPEAFEPI
jgi:ketosteroid isomerase-like protein